MSVYDSQSQRNPSYAAEELGVCAGVTIGKCGCFITVAADMWTHYTGVLHTPDEVNRSLRYADGCLYPDDGLCQLVPGVQLAEVYHCETIPCDLRKLAMADDEEVLAVIKLMDSPSGFHCVRVFSGTTAADLTVDDPYYGDRVKFSARYGNPVTAIVKLIRYRLPGFVPPWKQPAPQPQPPQPPTPAYATEAEILAILQRLDRLEGFQGRVAKAAQP